MSGPEPTPQGQKIVSTALVTSSYRGDFERCRLLCESIDRRVSGHTRHLILVEPRDLKLFHRLAGPRREIVDERDLLPRFLRAVPDPMTLGRRRVWVSPYGPPLHGWHVQQLRRLSMADRLDETAMISIDSDVVFVRDVDVSLFHEGGRVDFFHRPGAVATLDEPSRGEHRRWAASAGDLLGLTDRPASDEGYIATVIAWRSDTVRQLRARLEAGGGGRHWMKILAGTRTLSECVLYGRFVDEIENRPDRHRRTAQNRCAMVWSGAAMGIAGLESFLAGLDPHHVAIGIQSFTGTDPALIRQAVGLGLAAGAGRAAGLGPAGGAGQAAGRD